jgi:hypothetical protein
VRSDGGLYFGASSYFEDEVLETLVRFPQLQFLILDASGINRISATGEQTVRVVLERLEEAGIVTLITRAKRQITGALQWVEGDAGKRRFFRWNQHALEFAWSQLEPHDRTNSPLHVLHPREGEGEASVYYIWFGAVRMDGARATTTRWGSRASGRHRMGQQPEAGARPPAAA